MRLAGIVADHRDPRDDLTRSPLITVMVLAAVTMAACGSTSPTPSAVVAPSVSPEPTSGASIADRHADADLEAQLPETLGAIALTRESQRGTDLSQHSDAMTTFLAGLGKTLDDFTVASAYSASGDIEAQVGAWRIRGAASALLMPGFIEAVQASSTTPLTISTASISRHDVTQIGAPGQLTQGPLYAYVRGDTIFFVQTTDPALASEALSELP